MFNLKTLATAAVLAAPLATSGLAQVITEAPSTVAATYVTESATVALAPGEKVENLYTKNNSQPFVLQKLTDRVYWVQSQFYATIFYVGDEGVLTFDALEGRTAAINDAIDQVTDLPITALLYSHNHADHIVDATVMLEENPDLRIIATADTAELIEHLGSNHPAPTDVIRDSFTFENLEVNVMPLHSSGHAHDHAIYALGDTGVIHIPDVINPDQPPFWSFAGAESYVGYRGMIDAIGALEWDYLSGGHGNIGSREDVTFYNTFLDDLEAAVGQALGEVQFTDGVEDPASVNAHTAFLTTWVPAVGARATEILRPKYGEFYGFEYATPKNAELVALAFFSYR